MPTLKVPRLCSLPTTSIPRERVSGPAGNSKHYRRIPSTRGLPCRLFHRSARPLPQGPRRHGSRLTRRGVGLFVSPRGAPIPNSARLIVSPAVHCARQCQPAGVLIPDGELGELVTTNHCARHRTTLNPQAISQGSQTNSTPARGRAACVQRAGVSSAGGNLNEARTPGDRLRREMLDRRSITELTPECSFPSTRH